MPLEYSLPLKAKLKFEYEVCDLICRVCEVLESFIASCQLECPQMMFKFDGLQTRHLLCRTEYCSYVIGRY